MMQVLSTVAGWMLNAVKKDSELEVLVSDVQMTLSCNGKLPRADVRLQQENTRAGLSEWPGGTEQVLGGIKEKDGRYEGMEKKLLPQFSRPPPPSLPRRSYLKTMRLTLTMRRQSTYDFMIVAGTFVYVTSLSCWATVLLSMVSAGSAMQTAW